MEDSGFKTVEETRKENKMNEIDLWVSIVLTTDKNEFPRRGTWHHIVTTNDAAGDLKFYVDGKPIASGTAALEIEKHFRAILKVVKGS